MERGPPRPGGPWARVLLAASVLGSCLQPAPAQSTRPPGTIVLSPPSPVVGGGVSLAPRDPPQNLLTCAWYRSATTDETRRILTYYPSAPSVPSIGPAHTGRETGGPGCALHIAGVTLSDTGNYSLLMEAPPNRVLAAVFVRVWEMLPRPTVTPNQTLVPENGTFSLTCNSSPSADTRLWLRDGEPLGPSRRLVLSPDNRTLTVLNVTRGDAGAYQCEVRNAVSSNHSEPSSVTVTYGPDSARTDPPGPILLPLGSPLTLTCVADSVPAPSYHWALNGTDTGQTGSSFTLTLTTSTQQGTYECQAHNSGTSLTAWASVTVRVPGPDSSPEVEAYVGPW
ncbi:cell adhesion molecule CEACAM6-like [Pelodiscus sinensis]|uniref:cell adhesion molecule CEACAM6-like n=1 Tax=Pelodiscus sinensis TaxID=13735 RepID=UPI003F6D6064